MDPEAFVFGACMAAEEKRRSSSYPRQGVFSE
jgi:hypothetical protein